MTLPANVRVNMSAPFPALVKGSGPIAIAKANGIWSVLLSYLGFGPSNAVPNPANTVVLVQDKLTGVFYAMPLSQIFANKVVKTLTAPGPYAALPTDEVLIVKQIVAAPFVITVDWSQRSKPLRVVDGKGDAAANNITITPANGQTQLASLNFSYVIDGNGGSITLTPLPDNSGAY